MVGAPPVRVPARVDDAPHPQAAGLLRVGSGGRGRAPGPRLRRDHGDGVLRREGDRLAGRADARGAGAAEREAAASDRGRVVRGRRFRCRTRGRRRPLDGVAKRRGLGRGADGHARPRSAPGVRRPRGRLGPRRLPSEICGKCLERWKGVVRAQGDPGGAGRTRASVPSRFRLALRPPEARGKRAGARVRPPRGRHPPARVFGDAHGVPAERGSRRPPRRVAPLLRRSGTLLGARRRRRRQRRRSLVRGRGARDGAWRLLPGAFPVERREALRVVRRGNVARASGRRPADSLRDPPPRRGPRARGHRVRGRSGGSVDDPGAVPRPQRRRVGREREVLSGGAADPGQSPLAVPEPAGRLLADPEGRTRGGRDAGRGKPFGRGARSPPRIRCFRVRRRRDLDVARSGRVASRRLGGGRRRVCLGGLRLGPPPCRGRLARRRRGRAARGGAGRTAGVGRGVRAPGRGSSAGLGRKAGRRRPRSAGPCRRVCADRAVERRLDPGQPRRPRDPAGLAVLLALVDPRRRPDLGGPPAAGPRLRGPRLSEMVRAVPVRRRESAVLRGPPRRGPGPRERQPRRAPLSGRRVLPVHEGPENHRGGLAAPRQGGRLHRHAAGEAAHPGVLGARQADLLRTPPRVDQPRGLLVAARCTRTGTTSGRSGD